MVPRFHCLRSLYIRSVMAVQAPRLPSIRSNGRCAGIRAAASLRFVRCELVPSCRGDFLSVSALAVTVAFARIIVAIGTIMDCKAASGAGRGAPASEAAWSGARGPHD